MKYISKFIKLLALSIISILPSTAFSDSRLDNCLLYKDQIMSILESENISTDYFYLAVCESGCKNKTSRSGAKGYFQLMPSTYRNFKPSTCSDEDIEKLECNVAAAAKYISHLQDRFKNMYVLIKAYNRGGTNYQRFGSTSEADGLSICVKRYIANKKE